MKKIKALFQIPDFRKLFLASFIELLGRWCISVGIYILIYQITGSALSIGFVIVARRSPQALFSMLGGYFADHHHKKKIMVFSYLAGAFTVPFLLLAHSKSEIWIVYIIGFLLSVGSTLFLQTQSAALYDIVHKEQLKLANSLLYLGQTLTMIIGAALGGFLYTKVGFEVLIYINIASYVLAALITLTMSSLKKTEHFEKVGGFISKLSGGWKKAKDIPQLRSLLIYNAFITIPFCAHNLILTIYPMQIFNMGSQGVGIFHSLFGVASFVGTCIVTRLTSYTTTSTEKHRPYLLVTCGILFMAIPFITSQLCALLLFTIEVTIFTVFLVNQNNTRLVASGHQHAGRIKGLDTTLQLIILMIFSPLYGYISDILNPKYIGVLAGALFILFPLLIEFIFKTKNKILPITIDQQKQAYHEA